MTIVTGDVLALVHRIILSTFTHQHTYTVPKICITGPYSGFYAKEHHIKTMY